MTRFHLTRRDVTGLFAAAPLALCPGVGLAAVDYRSELEGYLQSMQFPHRPAQFYLRSFEIIKSGQRVEMQALIDLHWPPGMRRRKFKAEAGDADFAFIILAGGIESYFASLT